MKKPKIAHLLRVFIDDKGNFGDLASIVLDGDKQISDEERRHITKKLNTGETIFVNDMTQASISVMHTQGEIDFAGVGILGAGWLLTKLQSKQPNFIHSRNSVIKFWQEKNLYWGQTSLTTLPSWKYKRLASLEAVENMNVADSINLEHTMYWAWINEDKGKIRARTFASDWDIPEAEGNGSGAMKLAVILNREIEIKHGKGSVIFAKPIDNNVAALGGRVTEDSKISL